MRPTRCQLRYRRSGLTCFPLFAHEKKRSRAFRPFFRPRSWNGKPPASLLAKRGASPNEPPALCQHASVAMEQVARTDPFVFPDPPCVRLVAVSSVADRASRLAVKSRSQIRKSLQPSCICRCHLVDEAPLLRERLQSPALLRISLGIPRLTHRVRFQMHRLIWDFPFF